MGWWQSVWRPGVSRRTVSAARERKGFQIFHKRGFLFRHERIIPNHFEEPCPIRTTNDRCKHSVLLARAGILPRHVVKLPFLATDLHLFAELAEFGFADRRQPKLAMPAIDVINVTPGCSGQRT